MNKSVVVMTNGERYEVPDECYDFMNMLKGESKIIYRDNVCFVSKYISSVERIDRGRKKWLRSGLKRLLEDA